MTRVLHRLALSLAVSLLSLPALAVGPAPAVRQSSSNKLSQSDNKALLAYQHDLVSVLAPRADALPLLAAALLARPLTNQPKVDSFHSLIGRAAGAKGSDAAVDWVRLADCDAKANACPNQAALEKLQSEAPDNAAVWLLKLGVDTHNLKSDNARDDLRKAAAASTYDDYTGTSLQALAQSVGVLPPPAVIGKARGGAIGTQAVLVYSLGSLQPQPGLPVVAQLCKNANDDASIKTDCLKLAKTLEWGSSPWARSLGLHLRQLLSDDDQSSQDDARQARTNLIWQVRSFNKLLHRAAVEPELARHLLALARNGGTEMSLMLASLRQAKLPVDAPADWKPPAPEASPFAK